MYPIYANCVELGIPIFVCAGVPGPRVPYAPQEVARIDVVMFDFPELVFVTRHGCEPWEDLAVKLMLKWPNLYYSTSAFAPKYYPKAIIDYANTRGADKVHLRRLLPDGAVARADLQRHARGARSRTRCGRSSCTATPHASSAWRAEQPMALAITAEQEQLVDAVSRFATRHAPIEKTRAMFDSIAAGELPPWWEEFIAHGFHAVHLPGGSAARTARWPTWPASIEAAAAAMLPGPLLEHGDGQRAWRAWPTTRRASLIADLAAGPPRSSCCPSIPTCAPRPTGTAGGSPVRSGSTLGICAAQRILLAAHIEAASNSGWCWNLAHRTAGNSPCSRNRAPTCARTSAC